MMLFTVRIFFEKINDKHSINPLYNSLGTKELRNRTINVVTPNTVPKFTIKTFNFSFQVLLNSTDLVLYNLALNNLIK